MAKSTTEVARVGRGSAEREPVGTFWGAGRGAHPVSLGAAFTQVPGFVKLPVESLHSRVTVCKLHRKEQKSEGQTTGRKERKEERRQRGREEEAGRTWSQAPLSLRAALGPPGQEGVWSTSVLRDLPDPCPAEPGVPGAPSPALWLEPPLGWVVPGYSEEPGRAEQV